MYSLLVFRIVHPNYTCSDEIGQRAQGIVIILGSIMNICERTYVLIVQEEKESTLWPLIIFASQL